MWLHLIKATFNPTLSKSAEVRDLGLIDSKLSFTSHIENIGKYLVVKSVDDIFYKYLRNLNSL